MDSLWIYPGVSLQNINYLHLRSTFSDVSILIFIFTSVIEGYIKEVFSIVDYIFFSVESAYTSSKADFIFTVLLVRSVTDFTLLISSTFILA